MKTEGTKSVYSKCNNENYPRFSMLFNAPKLCDKILDKHHLFQISIALYSVFSLFLLSPTPGEHQWIRYIFSFSVIITLNEQRKGVARDSNNSTDVLFVYYHCDYNDAFRNTFFYLLDLLLLVGQIQTNFLNTFWALFLYVILLPSLWKITIFFFCVCWFW